MVIKMERRIYIPITPGSQRVNRVVLTGFHCTLVYLLDMNVLAGLASLKDDLCEFE